MKASIVPTRIMNNAKPLMIVIAFSAKKISHSFMTSCDETGFQPGQTA
jgi:hypothetical protein